MNRTSIFFLLSIVCILFSGCTSRNSQESVSTDLNNGGNLFSPPPLTTSPAPTVTSCTEAFAASVELLINQTDYQMGASIPWSLNLAGCPSYRVTPLIGDNLVTQIYSGNVNQHTIINSFSTAQTNVIMSFRVEGLTSAGDVDKTTLIISQVGINILDNTSPNPDPGNEVPDNFACSVVPDNQLINVPVDENRNPIGGLPTATFAISTGDVSAKVVSLQAPQNFPLFNVLNLNTAAVNTQHSVMVSFNYSGNIPVIAKVAADADPTITKECYTNVYLNPQPIVPPVPPEAPSCEITLSKTMLYADEQLVATVLATGLVDEAKLNNVVVPLSNPIQTITASQAGTHTIQGQVQGPGGVGSCDAQYDVYPDSLMSNAFYNSCAVVGGKVKCWGYNRHGELGNGNNTQSLVPVNVMGFGDTEKVVQIFGGEYHTCAVNSAGSAKCWGYNGHGQLGDNSKTNRNVASQVYGLDSGVTDISSYAAHTCAVHNGAAKCWGKGTYGVLGTNSSSQSSVPMQVYGLEQNVKSVAVATSHSCALMDDGAVKCWGHGGHGRLGNNASSTSKIPVNVYGLDAGSGVTKLAAAYAQSCVIQNGGLKCWGYNAYGALGDNSRTHRSIPTAVYGLDSGVKDIAMGTHHACALMETGQLKCWGWNGHGSLGIGSTTQHLVPIDVISDVAQVSAANLTTCAVKNLPNSTSNKFLCWGYNAHGQLGNNSTTGSSVPFEVYPAYLSN